MGTGPLSLNTQGNLPDFSQENEVEKDFAPLAKSFSFLSEKLHETAAKLIAESKHIAQNISFWSNTLFQGKNLENTEAQFKAAILLEAASEEKDKGKKLVLLNMVYEQLSSLDDKSKLNEVAKQIQNLLIEAQDPAGLTLFQANHLLQSGDLEEAWTFLNHSFLQNPDLAQNPSLLEFKNKLEKIRIEIPRMEGRAKSLQILQDFGEVVATQNLIAEVSRAEGNIPKRNAACNFYLSIRVISAAGDLITQGKANTITDAIAYMRSHRFITLRPLQNSGKANLNDPVGWAEGWILERSTDYGRLIDEIDHNPFINPLIDHLQKIEWAHTQTERNQRILEFGKWNREIKNYISARHILGQLSYTQRNTPEGIEAYNIVRDSEGSDNIYVGISDETWDFVQDVLTVDLPMTIISGGIAGAGRALFTRSLMALGSRLTGTTGRILLNKGFQIATGLFVESALFEGISLGKEFLQGKLDPHDLTGEGFLKRVAKGMVMFGSLNFAKHVVGFYQIPKLAFPAEFLAFSASPTFQAYLGLMKPEERADWEKKSIGEHALINLKELAALKVGQHIFQVPGLQEANQALQEKYQKLQNEIAQLKNNPLMLQKSIVQTLEGLNPYLKTEVDPFIQKTVLARELSQLLAQGKIGAAHLLTLSQIVQKGNLSKFDRWSINAILKETGFRLVDKNGELQLERKKISAVSLEEPTQKDPVSGTAPERMATSYLWDAGLSIFVQTREGVQQLYGRWASRVYTATLTSVFLDSTGHFNLAFASLSVLVGLGAKVALTHMKSKTEQHGILKITETIAEHDYEIKHPDGTLEVIKAGQKILDFHLDNNKIKASLKGHTNEEHAAIFNQLLAESIPSFVEGLKKKQAGADYAAIRMRTYLNPARLGKISDFAVREARLHKSNSDKAPSFLERFFIWEYIFSSNHMEIEQILYHLSRGKLRTHPTQTYLITSKDLQANPHLVKEITESLREKLGGSSKASPNDITAHYPRMMELQESYLDQVRAQNAVVSEEKIPLWKFVEDLESAPEWLKVYAQANPYLEVQKINFIPDRLGEDGNKGAHSLGNMVRDIQNNFHLPLWSLYKLFEHENEYVLSLHLMPASLLMESRFLIPRRYPVNLKIGKNLEDHESVVAMMAENTRPFLITDQPNTLHSLRDLHPFIQMIHDYAHLLIMDKLNPQQRSDLLSVYQAARRLPMALLKSGMNEESLGRILEGTFLHSDHNLFPNLFNMIKNSPPPVDFLIAWRAELEISFPEGHPSRSAAFKAFEMTFGKTIREYLASKPGGSSGTASVTLSSGSSSTISMPLERFDPTWDHTNGPPPGSEFNGVMPPELLPTRLRNPGVAYVEKVSSPNASGPIATPPQAQAIRNLRERFFSLWGTLYLRGTAAALSFSKNPDRAEMYELSSTLHHDDLAWYQTLRTSFYGALKWGYQHAVLEGRAFNDVELRLYMNRMRPMRVISTKEFSTVPFKERPAHYQQVVVEGKTETAFARIEQREEKVRDVFSIRPTPEEVVLAEQQASHFIERHPDVHEAYTHLLSAQKEVAQLKKIVEAEKEEHQGRASNSDITAKVFLPPHWQAYLKARDGLDNAEESFSKTCSETLGYESNTVTKSSLHGKLGLTRKFLGDILWKRFYGQLENLIDNSRPLPQEEVQDRSIAQALENNKHLAPHYPKIVELQKSYVDSLWENGTLAASSLVSLRQFVETLGPSVAPMWLQEYAKQYPDLVLKKISYDDSQTNIGYALTKETFEYIESFWGLPRGTLYKKSDQKTQSIIDCVLLPAQLLMDARQLIPGSQPVNVEVTSLLSSHEKTIELAGQDTRPFLIGNQSHDLHGAKDVHPYLQTLHDYIHLLLLDGLSPQVRAELLTIYQSAHRLSEVKELQLEDSTLGRIPEAAFFEPDVNIYLSVFYLIEAIKLSPQSLVELRAELDTSFPEGYPHRRKILDSFDVCFGRAIEKYLDWGSL